MCRMSTDTLQTSAGLRLKGKVCIVTGAGSGKGIGWGTVVKFAAEGVSHIYILDVHTNELDTLSLSLEATHPATKVTVVNGDATDEETVEFLCNRAVQEHGRLDVFFANAGALVGGMQAFCRDMSAETFMNGLRTNALSCFLAAKHATRAMEKVNAESGKLISGGSIIFTSSLGGSRAEAKAVEYCASKAAIMNMAMNIAYENQLMRNGVRVNAVCPGAIDTAMSTSVFTALKEAQQSMPEFPDARIVKPGSPQEVAHVVSFLASDESSYVNGQSWNVDGGTGNPLTLGYMLDSSRSYAIHIDTVYSSLGRMGLSHLDAHSSVPWTMWGTTASRGVCNIQDAPFETRKHLL